MKATYNGSTVSTTVFVNPIPPVTITQADYVLDTKLGPGPPPHTNSVLTYGGEAANGPFGTMQFEQGVWKGASSSTRLPDGNRLEFRRRHGLNGGDHQDRHGRHHRGRRGAVAPPARSNSPCDLGQGHGYRQSSAASYAPGTVVTLTATPAAGSPWVGWVGMPTGTANPIKITINRDMKVTANFR